MSPKTTQTFRCLKLCCRFLMTSTPQMLRATWKAPSLRLRRQVEPACDVSDYCTISPMLGGMKPVLGHIATLDAASRLKGLSAESVGIMLHKANSIKGGEHYADTL